MTPTLLAAPTLDELLQRFLALTEIAMRACASEDVAALAGALDARELTNNRLIALGRTGGRPRGPLPEATRRMMAEAHEANAALEGQVATARDEIHRQLNRVTHGESGVAGYAGAAPRTSRVDVKR